MSPTIRVVSLLVAFSFIAACAGALAIQDVIMIGVWALVVSIGLLVSAVIYLIEKSDA